MPQSLDPKDVERLLRRLPVSKAPATLWEGIQTALESPEPTRSLPPLQRPVPRWLLAAAVVLAVVTGSLGGVFRWYRAPSAWVVVPVTGALRADSPTALYAATVYVREVQAGRPENVVDVPVTVVRSAVPSYTR